MVKAFIETNPAVKSKKSNLSFSSIFMSKCPYTCGGLPRHFNLQTFYMLVQAAVLSFLDLKSTRWDSNPQPFDHNEYSLPLCYNCCPPSKDKLRKSIILWACRWFQWKHWLTRHADFRPHLPLPPWCCRDAARSTVDHPNRTGHDLERVRQKQVLLKNWASKVSSPNQLFWWKWTDWLLTFSKIDPQNNSLKFTNIGRALKK